jgi:hypothetical protein
MLMTDTVFLDRFFSDTLLQPVPNEKPSERETAEKEQNKKKQKTKQSKIRNQVENHVAWLKKDERAREAWEQ